MSQNLDQGPRVGRGQKTELPEPVNKTLLTKGSRSPEVTKLQEQLNQEFGSRLTCDGDYGSATQYAVAMYQATRGLKASGAFDTLTKKALEEHRAALEHPGIDCLPAKAGVEGHRVEKKGKPDEKSVAFNFDACQIGSHLMSKETAAAYLEMFSAAKKDGIFLEINNAYRSFEEQQKLYQKYKEDPKHTALASPPGFSAHERGDAIDLKVASGDPRVDGWLKKNASKFGFDRDAQGEKWHITWHAQKPKTTQPAQ